MPTLLSRAGPVLTILAMLAAGAWQPAAAEFAGATRFSAAASFADEDATGCLRTEVSVFVRGQSTAAAGQRPLVTLSLSRVDQCRDAALVRGEARDVRTGAFQVSPNLASATLSAAVPIRDPASGGVTTAQVRIVWTAAEPAISATRGDEPVGPGRFLGMKSPLQRSMRLARAAGQVSLARGDLTLTPAEDAWIALARGGIPAGR
jgi:hypothetical protein